MASGLRVRRVGAGDLSRAEALFRDDQSGEVARPDPAWLDHVTRGAGAIAVLVQLDRRDIALVQFDLEPVVAYASVFIRADRRGRGLFRPVLAAALGSLPPQIGTVLAFISADNRASVAAFSAAGFSGGAARDADGFLIFSLSRDAGGAWPVAS